MFVYNVTINDVVYKTEQNNQTFKIDESLDSAVLVIPFTTRQEAFNRFDNVIITSSDGETTRQTHWLIWADQISIATNYPIRYQHTLALIETTKILEKYACGSLTDTQPLNAPQRTIYDVLERIRLLSPFVPYQYIYETRAFEIDETLKTYIQTVKAPQFYLDKKNLREAVIEVFKYINAIPRLQYEYEKNYGIYVYRLYADFVNQRKLNITPSNENITTKRLTDFTDEVNGEHYATQVETYLENIVPSEDGIANIYSASKTEYVSFRSNEIVVGQSNIKIILPEKIENLVNIKLITTLVGQSNITEIDMLPFCVEKNIYDTLEINGGVGSRRYSFYWSKGSNELDGFNYTNDVLFPTMALTNILNYVNSSVSIWQDVLFKIEYIPRIENMRSEIYREDYNYLKESEIQLNQGERINSLFDVTNNIYGQIQRIGVDTLSVSKIHKTLHAYDSTHLNGIWSLGDYTSDGYFITTVELIYYSYYVVARYEMSMNWNRIAQFIQIDKEFRPYEIALTKSDYTLKRELAMPFAFIEISNTQRMNQESLEKYQTLITPFMRTLKSAATYELPITNAFLDVNGGVGTIVPLTIMAEKNTLKWRFGFDNTILSGNRVIRKTAFLSEVYEQKQVKYAKNDGTLQFASISLFNGLWQYINSTSDMLIGMSNASKDLPYADINKNVLGTIESYEASIYENFDSFPLPQQIGALVVALDENAIYRYTEFGGYFIVDNIVAYKKDFVFDLPTYMILKDKSEILGFNLSIPILPYKTEFNRFIIGDMLSKDNGLIKARQSGKSIYLRSTNSFFDKSNTKKFFDANDQYLIPANLITANYVDVSSIPFNYDNFAITDLNDNLYLAINQRNLDGTKTTINKIYFNFVERRTKADVHVEDIPTKQINWVVSVYLEEQDRINAIVKKVESYNVSISFEEEDRINIAVRKFEPIVNNVQISFNEEDRINVTVNKYENKVIITEVLFVEEDRINVIVNQRIYESKVSVDFLEEDRINVIVNKYENKAISVGVSFKEEDYIGLTFKTTLTTIAPTISFVGKYSMGSGNYRYVFDIINNDLETSKLFAAMYQLELEDDYIDLGYAVYGAKKTIDIIVNSSLGMNCNAYAKTDNKNVSTVVTSFGS